MVELAYGVEDWTTEAALYALITAAWVDPSCRADVAKLVETRNVVMREAAKTRPVTIGISVAQLVYITSGMPSKTLQHAVNLTAALETWPGDGHAKLAGLHGLVPQRKSLLDRLRGR